MAFEIPGGSDHPTWLTAVGTFLGYAVIIAVLAVLLFGVPYLVFVAL